MGQDDDWDLQAVVRSCGGAAPTAAMTDPPPSSAPPPLRLQGSRGAASLGDDLLLCCFPELFSTPTELRDPIFSNQQQQKQKQQVLPILPQSSPLPLSTTMTATSTSTSSSVIRTSAATSSQRHTSKAPLPPQNPRSKRRKCQQKMVVCQVPADGGTSSDLWAWRKYGQKPIKGSPFPRGYYRCSSSKGCMARKQVERSRMDPNALVVTYTGDHNHPLPTPRNSLAGTSASHRLPSTPSSASTAAQQVSSASADPSTSPPTATPKAEDGDELEEEGMLTVSDVELLGEDDMVVIGSETEPPCEHEPCSVKTLSPFSWMANSSSAASGDGSHRALAQSLV